VPSKDENPSDTLADYLIVSEASIGDKLIIDVLSRDETYAKCERSWKYFKPIAGATITPRDEVAFCAWDKTNV